MKAIIMAGGFGTRLRPVTGDMPKPMAALAGRPIMEHVINQLRICGFCDICAAVKYRAQDIMDYFGDGSRFGVQLQYRVEDAPLGTAGAVKNCADFYGAEDFLVISADAACDFDLSLLMAEHKKRRAAATIALHRETAPLRYGLALSDFSGRIRTFIEKPDWPHVVTDTVNTGIYALSPRAMELVPQGAEYDFGKQLFPELLRRGERLIGLPMAGYWCDIGTPLAYYKCCVDAIEGRLKVSVPEEFQCGTSAVAKTAVSVPGDGAGDRSEFQSGTSAVLKNEASVPGDGAGDRSEFQSGTSAVAKTAVSVPGDGAGDRSKTPSGTSEILIPCADRAGLMARLSTELMELGPDYSEGILLCGGRLWLNIRPAAELSALRLAVRSADTEFAAHMLDRAKAAVEELEKRKGDD